MGQTLSLVNTDLCPARKAEGHQPQLATNKTTTKQDSQLSLMFVDEPGLESHLAHRLWRTVLVLLGRENWSPQSMVILVQHIKEAGPPWRIRGTELRKSLCVPDLPTLSVTS